MAQDGRTSPSSAQQDALSILVLVASFVAGTLAILWLNQGLAPLDGLTYRKDPRVFLYILLVIFVGYPAILYRRASSAQGLSGWSRVRFTAIATLALLAASWGLLWYATTDLPGAGFLDASLAGVADLVHPASRWNAGTSLVLGVWFWITSYFVASAGKTPAPM